MDNFQQIIIIVKNVKSKIKVDKVASTLKTVTFAKYYIRQSNMGMPFRSRVAETFDPTVNELAIVDDACMQSVQDNDFLGVWNVSSTLQCHTTIH